MNYLRELRFKFLDGAERLRKIKKNHIRKFGVIKRDFLGFLYSVKIIYLLLKTFIVTIPFYLFYSPNRSFWMIYKRSPTGIYKTSYSKHIKYQKIIVGLLLLIIILIFAEIIIRFWNFFSA